MQPGGPYPQLLSLGGYPVPWGACIPLGVPFHGCPTLQVLYPMGAVTCGVPCPPHHPPLGAPTLGVAPPKQPIAPRGPSLGHILGGKPPQWGESLEGGWQLGGATGIL